MAINADVKVESPMHIERKLVSKDDARYDLSVLNAEDAEFLMSFSEEDRKRVIRKVCFGILETRLTT